MKKHVHIIGGGIIGLCSAYYLQQEGFEVTVVDKDTIQEGTSIGNAGMIVPSHFVPLAAPGVIAQGIKWLFQSSSPFFIKPRFNLDLAQWLWAFYRSCTKEHVLNSMDLLKIFNETSRDLYEEFTKDAEFSFCFEKKGLLMVFQDRKVQESEVKHAEKAISLGIATEILNESGLETLEPNIKINALGGVYYPDDAHLYPQLFIKQLADKITSRGGRILENCSVEDIESSANKVSSFNDQLGKKHPVDQILFASGAWTGKLLKKLHTKKILLQDGKGYSITIKSPQLRPQIPTILCESKVAVTPMGNDLRIGGTLEISNFSKKINASRLEGIFESIPSYYPELSKEALYREKVWHGYRPCTPTGLPIVSKIPTYSNGFIATGHGMMGMSLGPATGKLISQIITNQKPDFDIELLRM